MATIKFDDSEWKEVKIGEYDDRIMSVQEAEEAAYLENALLPCPFCGGHIEAARSAADTLRRIYCTLWICRMTALCPLFAALTAES